MPKPSPATRENKNNETTASEDKTNTEREREKRTNETTTIKDQTQASEPEEQ